MGHTGRAQVRRAERALGHALPEIRRLEWTLNRTAPGIEARCHVLTRRGDWGAKAVEATVSAAVHEVTQKILIRERRAKKASLTRRKTIPVPRATASP